MRPRDRVKRHIKTTKMLHCAPVHNASADGEVAWVKVVFVHGALVFDGAWWWHRMSEPLAGLGLGTRALEIPSCVAPPVVPSESMGDMHADADTVRAALDEEDEQVVLVGHSYGGMVITDAAAGHGKVEHLVYITSVMPELGETLAGFGAGREPGPWMDPNPEEGTMGLIAELAPEAFMQDCDGEAVAGALRRLTRQPLAVSARRGVAGEALDVRGVRRGPGDVCAGATGVRQEGGSCGGTADGTPPDALASRAVGPGARGGRQAGQVSMKKAEWLIRG
jgi:pimeloyl-ACP methyl ester carboxylesterase